MMHPFLKSPCLYCGSLTWIDRQDLPVCYAHQRMHNNLEGLAK